MATIEDVRAVAPSLDLCWKDPRPRWDVDYERQTGSGECGFWVKLNELSAAMNVIEGTEETVVLSASPLIEVTRYVPLQHPYEPLLYMNRMAPEIYFGVEPDDPAIRQSGDMVKLIVGFTWRPFGMTDDAYQQVDMRGTQVEVPADGATFFGGGTPSFEPSRRVPGASYSVTVNDAPGFNETHEAYLNSLAGGLNNAVWRGNAIGTVMFHSPTVRYNLKRNGSRTATYSLQFDTRPFDWNLEFNRAGATDTLLVGGSVRHPYIDFRSLFI